MCKIGFNQFSRYVKKRASLWIFVSISNDLSINLSVLRLGYRSQFLAHLWATVYKTLRRVLSDNCPVCLSCLSFSGVGVLWPNGWMDRGETWQRGRPWSRPRCIRWRSIFPIKGTAPQPPNFRLMSVVAKRLDGYEDARRHCVRWGPSSPPQKGGSAPPNFGPCIVAKRRNGSRCHLVGRYRPETRPHYVR